MMTDKTTPTEHLIFAREVHRRIQCTVSTNVSTCTMVSLLCLVRRQARIPQARAFFSRASKATSSAADEDRVVVSVDSDGIAQVRLNRPEKLNALDLPMFEAIANAASDLKSDRKLRADILSGNGRAFCTGLDVKSMIRNDPNGTIERLLERPQGRITNLAQDVAYLWREIPAPVIAAVHGMCFGGGFQIALGADFRIATPDSKISIMESKWGLIPDMGISVTLRELVRIDVAKELTMTGRIVNGLEACEIGLITRCAEDPHKEALELAKAITKRSPDSVALAKQLYQETWDATVDEEALRLETDFQRQLLKTWNQLAASGRNFGLKVPYAKRKNSTIKTNKDL